MPVQPKTRTAPTALPTPSSGADAPLWQDVSTEFTRRSVAMEIYGDTDTGKSTLALTAPGPIAYIHAYEKLDGILQHAASSKLIRTSKFRSTFRGEPEMVQLAATASVERIEQAMYSAYTWARTIIVDTHTELWQTYQLARLGSLVRAERGDRDNRMGQLVYTEINNKFMTMLKEFRIRQDEPLHDKPTNLILIGLTKDEYRKSKQSGRSESTGKKIAAGQKSVPPFCDLRLETQYDKRGDRFLARVEKPWYNTDMRGFEIDGDLLSFPQIMGLVTETDAEEWS